MEGKNILCTNREIMHLCQVNKIGQHAWPFVWFKILNFNMVFFVGGWGLREMNIVTQLSQDSMQLKRLL